MLAYVKGESGFVDRVCYDSISCILTGRTMYRRQNVVIYSGEAENPFYAKIVDFYRDQYGSLMAWIYWYYR